MVGGGAVSRTLYDEFYPVGTVIERLLYQPMIKARIKGNLRKGIGDVIILGISRDNVERLTKGEPIKVDLSEMDMEGEILIFFKETTGDLIKTIQPYLGKGTQIDDRLG